MNDRAWTGRQAEALRDEFLAAGRSYLPMGSAAPHTTVAFAIRGPIARTDLAGLCNRVCALLDESRPGVALCDARGVEPDAVTVDALARLQLAARRYGCRVRLRHASDELLELVAFMGLSEILPDRLEAGGSPANDPIEMDFMYGRSFQDPDGHQWELIWMDPSAIEQQ